MRKKERKGTQFSDGFREFYKEVTKLSTSRIQSMNQIA